MIGGAPERAGCHAICALAGEAGTLSGAGIRVTVCGPGFARAGAAAEQCLDQSPRLVLSWGLAGGLRPGLTSGELILPGCVTTGDGRTWTSGAGRGTLLSVPKPVLRARDKHELWLATRCDAVDTETAAIARACAARKVKFVAVRAIVDSADRDVPAWLAGLTNGAGRVPPRRLLPPLLRHRGAVPALIRAFREYHAALATLRRVAMDLESLLGDTFVDERMVTR